MPAKKKKIRNTAYAALDEFDYIQALDYSNVLLVSYYHTMGFCRAVKKNERINAAYVKAIEAMSELYQIIGQESHK